VQKKEKRWRDLDVGTRRGNTGNVWKERKEGAECAMRREKETIEHMWNGCSKMRERERERKERGEIRVKMDERDMEEEGKDRKRMGWGIRKKC
jgi:hypothetical protein